MIRTFGALAFASLLAGAARGQCPTWSSNFGGPGLDDVPTCMLAYDDGTGPSLFVGGEFTHASGLSRSHIARWDGVHWNDLDGGLNSTPYALCTFDDGSGTALYVGGTFQSAGDVPAYQIARWKDGAWSALSGGAFSGAVHALCVFDDGAGPALYAGGDFTDVGGFPANRVARWTGTSWMPLGAGMNATVLVLCVYDGGSGPNLYAGGSFTEVDGNAASRVARWDGSSWQALGAGVNGTADDLIVHDDGSGTRLYVGGEFYLAGGQPALGVARWDGAQWSAVGALHGAVWDLERFDDGSGMKLYATKSYLTDGTGNYTGGMFAWNGSSWALTTAPASNSFIGPVLTDIGVADLGFGSEMFVGGNVAESAWIGVVNNIVKLVGDSSAPHVPLQDAGAGGLSRDVSAFAEFDDGLNAGPTLYAGGNFISGNGVPLSRIARWNGSAWQPLGSGVDGRVYALAVHDDGTGAALWVGGDFYHAGGIPTRGLARWDGSSWSAPVAVPLSISHVTTLLSADIGQGPRLYIGGTQGNAQLGDPHGVAVWDGSIVYGLGDGLWTYGGLGAVLSLAAFDAGQGPQLYGGGSFTHADGVAIPNLARWNGTSWSAFGGGYHENVRTLATIDLGSGPALYIGAAYFNGAMSIARWNGTQLTAMTNGFGSFPIRAFAAFDAGLGAGKQLWIASHMSLKVWNGTAWTSPAGSLGDATLGGVTAQNLSTYQALQAHDDGTGSPGLWVGGSFTLAKNGSSSSDALPSSNVARYLPCNHPGTPFCFGDGVDPQVTTACPCSNFGSVGHGCANSVYAAGGLLRATGSTLENANTGTDSLLLQASSVRSTVIFLQGSAPVSSGAVFGDGVRCAGGSLIRLGVVSSSGGAASYPGAGDDSVSIRGQIAPNGAATRYYQAYYRDPDPVFCPSATFNVTNGVKIVW